MSPDTKDNPLVPSDEAEASRIEFLDVVSGQFDAELAKDEDRKSTRLNSSHMSESRMPSSA